MLCVCVISNLDRVFMLTVMLSGCTGACQSYEPT